MPLRTPQSATSPNAGRDAATLDRRRWLLRAGSLGLAGLSLPTLLRAEATVSANTGSRMTPGKARSCILVFLEGGPAHQDLWDMKPAAPAEVRGEFQPIDTSASGIQICEHLPLLSRQMHHLALVRSVHHKVVDHNAGAYYALTGRPPFAGGRLIVRDEPDNFPPFGAVLARLAPVMRTLPSFVQLPEFMSNNGYELPGQRAGFLGPRFDPLTVGDPSAAGYRVPGLSLPKEFPLQRLADRRELRNQLNAASPIGKDIPDIDANYQRAFDLLSTQETQLAFDLSRESVALRERYGLPDRTDRSKQARDFGGLPHLGQCMLLARRLIESGVRLVTVASGRRFDQAWDTHRKHFPLLKRSLLPYFDRAFSALLEDMSASGLLEETLVVAIGEFGRTPRLGQITSGAGADAAGRDHWPHCYTVLFAGAGIRGGTVFGSSDKFAAYPKLNPVTPEDIAATIYEALGISPETRVLDPLNRPHSVALGKPIREVFA